MIKKTCLFAIILFTIFTFQSCEDKKEVNTSMNVEMQINGNDLIIGNTYDLNGTKVIIENAMFYIGGLTYNIDGSEIESSDEYFLVKNGALTIQQDFGKDVKKLEKITFYVGVDPTTNALSEMDFTEREIGDPLGIQDPSMHWSWNTGYKFLRIDGKADLNDDGTPETNISYHIGNNDFLTNINVNANKELDNEVVSLGLAFDLNTFFKNVDFKVDVDTHTGNNIPLALKLTENLKTAFSLK